MTWALLFKDGEQQYLHDYLKESLQGMPCVNTTFRQINLSYVGIDRQKVMLKGDYLTCTDW